MVRDEQTHRRESWWRVIAFGGDIIIQHGGANFNASIQFGFQHLLKHVIRRIWEQFPFSPARVPFIHRREREREREREDPRWLQCPRQLETRTRILSEDFLYLRRTLIGSFQLRQYRNNKGSNSRVLQVAVSNHFVLLHFFSSRCLKFNKLNQKKKLSLRH